MLIPCLVLMGLRMAGAVRVGVVHHMRHVATQQLIGPDLEQGQHCHKKGRYEHDRQRRGRQHRSEERRVGKEGVSTCRSRGSPYNSKKKMSISINTPTQTHKGKK